MQSHYFGHSAFQVTVDGVNILIDPFITGNPTAAGINPDSLTPDVILVTHGHGDHVGDAAAISIRTGAPIIAIYEIADWFAKRGVTHTIGINLGGTVSFKDLKIQLVPAWHSSTMPDGAPGGVAGGFIVTYRGGCFYHSGDTALFEEMKLFGRRHAIDTAFLCLGGHFTMDAVDAAHAASYLGAKRVIGMHFDTFDPIKIDHDAAHAAFKAVGIPLILPQVGHPISD